LQQEGRTAKFSFTIIVGPKRALSRAEKGKEIGQWARQAPHSGDSYLPSDCEGPVRGLTNPQCAPTPSPWAQDVEDCRCADLIRIKKLLPEDHELRRLSIRKLPRDALDQFEPQLLTACRTSARRPDAVPAGELRRVEDVDGNGLRIVSWVGQRSFMHDFTRPGRRVTGFRVRPSSIPVGPDTGRHLIPLGLDVSAKHHLMAGLAQPRFIATQTGDDLADIGDKVAARAINAAPNDRAEVRYN
jgi:hypothetical protein